MYSSLLGYDTVLVLHHKDSYSRLLRYDTALVSKYSVLSIICAEIIRLFTSLMTKAGNDVI